MVKRDPPSDSRRGVQAGSVEPASVLTPARPGCCGGVRGARPTRALTGACHERESWRARRAAQLAVRRTQGGKGRKPRRGQRVAIPRTRWLRADSERRSRKVPEVHSPVTKGSEEAQFGSLLDVLHQRVEAAVIDPHEVLFEGVDMGDFFLPPSKRLRVVRRRNGPYPL